MGGEKIEKEVREVLSQTKTKEENRKRVIQKDFEETMRKTQGT